MFRRTTVVTNDLGYMAGQSTHKGGGGGVVTIQA